MMEPDKIRKWIDGEPLTAIIVLLEALGDELEARDFPHAAGRVRDAQADLIARLVGRRQGAKP